MVADVVKREIIRLETKLQGVERYVLEARRMRDVAIQKGDRTAQARFHAAMDLGLEKWLMIHDILILLPVDLRTWPE